MGFARDKESKTFILKGMVLIDFNMVSELQSLSLLSQKRKNK